MLKYDQLNLSKFCIAFLKKVLKIYFKYTVANFNFLMSRLKIKNKNQLAAVVILIKTILS